MKEATSAPPPAYQQQHQRENVYKSWRLDLFNLSTVFEVCDVGQGNLAISKLLALKSFGPFLQSTYYWMSHSTFWGGVGLWVPVVTVVCGVVCAGCVCTARTCCFVSLTRTSAPKHQQTMAYWGLPESSQ
jgi:hypothetical protein